MNEVKKDLEYWTKIAEEILNHKDRDSILDILDKWMAIVKRGKCLLCKNDICPLKKRSGAYVLPFWTFISGEWLAHMKMTHGFFVIDSINLLATFLVISKEEKEKAIERLKDLDL